MDLGVRRLLDSIRQGGKASSEKNSLPGGILPAQFLKANLLFPGSRRRNPIACWFPARDPGIAFYLTGCRSEHTAFLVPAAAPGARSLAVGGALQHAICGPVFVVIEFVVGVILLGHREGTAAALGLTLADVMRGEGPADRGGLTLLSREMMTGSLTRRGLSCLFLPTAGGRPRRRRGRRAGGRPGPRPRRCSGWGGQARGRWPRRCRPWRCRPAWSG